MNMENLRNIVILKDLPSNLIEEAFVVLKKNQKVKNLEHIDNYKDFTSEKNGEDDKDFIIREAEMLIENYIDNNNEYSNNTHSNNFEKKYKRLKKFTAILSCILFFSIIYILLWIKMFKQHIN